MDKSGVRGTLDLIARLTLVTEGGEYAAGANGVLGDRVVGEVRHIDIVAGGVGCDGRGLVPRRRCTDGGERAARADRIF